MNADDRIGRGLMYLAGCCLFSLGVKLFIDAQLGVDPLHAMVIGFERKINQPYVQIGLLVSAVTIVMLLVWALWNRRLPPLPTFLTMAIVGFLVDGWNYIHLESLTGRALGPVPMMLTGLLCDAYGSALIIMSGIGIRVMDLLAITIMKRWRWRFFAAKLFLEGLFVATALLFGGPVGFATLAFLCVVGPFVEPMIWVNRRFLKLSVWGSWTTVAPGAHAVRPYRLKGQAPSLAERQG